MILEWLQKNNLTLETSSWEKYDEAKRLAQIELKNGVKIVFGSEPDVTFYVKNDLIALLKIEGGTDSAGALERYGAAKKSFEHSLEANRRCKNFYVVAIITPELDRRIADVRLMENYFNFIELLENPSKREEFFRELFHHTLRMI